MERRSARHARLCWRGRPSRVETMLSPAGAKGEPSTTTKKIIVRVGGWRHSMGAEVPDTNVRNVQHSVGDEEILEVQYI